MTAHAGPRRWPRLSILAAVAALVAIGVAGAAYVVGYGLPPVQPWYELGSPGTASNGGTVLRVGCNETPTVTGADWPSDVREVTLTWYGGTGLKPTQTEVAVNTSGEFSGAAPPLIPSSGTGTYWLLVYDKFLDQTGVPFTAAALPANGACPG